MGSQKCDTAEQLSFLHCSKKYGTRNLMAWILVLVFVAKKTNRPENKIPSVSVFCYLFCVCLVFLPSGLDLFV